MIPDKFYLALEAREHEVLAARLERAEEERDEAVGLLREVEQSSFDWIGTGDLQQRIYALLSRVSAKEKP